MTYRIGVDLGGTKIEVALVDPAGDLQMRRRVATPSDDYPAICAAITGLVNEVEMQIGTRATLGVGIPGTLSPATGLVKNANTTCLNGHRIDRDLALRLDRPVKIENDANCLVLSEVNGGAADEADPVFGIIIGTGTGGALFANGALVTGANAIAGEWGHNPVPWSVDAGRARACFCGRYNCVETFLCGAGLLRTFVEQGGCMSEVPDVQSLVAAASLGAHAALRALESYRDQITACIATVVNVIDPAVIVLGGGMSNLAGLCADIGARLETVAFSDSLVTRVVSARFGDSSGVRGAALLWGPGEFEVR